MMASERSRAQSDTLSPSHAFPLRHPTISAGAKSGKLKGTAYE